MQAAFLTVVLLAGAVPSTVTHHASVGPAVGPVAVTGTAYVPPVWYESIFCCGGNMPQTCYEPRFGCYSGTSRFSHRYPAFHGTHYRRPYSYRQYFDYPWQAGLHEPTSMFAYNVEDAVGARALPGAPSAARRGSTTNSKAQSYARMGQDAGQEEQSDAPQQGSLIVPTVDPGYLKYLISEVARGVSESNEQKEQARQATAEKKEQEPEDAVARINQVTHLDPRTLAAAVNAVQSAQLYSPAPAQPTQQTEATFEPIEPVVVQASPLEPKSASSQWRRRDNAEKK